MRIVALYPYLDPKINSIAQAMLWLGANGNDVLVIAARTANSLKGNLTFDPESRFPGVTIIRPYSTSREQGRRFRSRYRSVSKRVKEFAPDVIFCSSFGNFDLARTLQRDLGVPIVANVEKLRGAPNILPIRGISYLVKMGAGPILSFAAKKYIRYVLTRVEALLFSFYGDLEYSRTMDTGGTPVHYVAWCNDSPTFEGLEKDPYHGIYIGGINNTKNTAELVAAIPILFEKTATKRFTVIGPGPYEEQMRTLAKQYPGKMEYITNVPLAEAQRRIAKAGYAFTPVIDMGWGFVGDCWSLKTVLVATHPMQGFINDNVDSLIAGGLNELPRVVGRLLTEPNLRRQIEENGFARHQREQSAQAVGEQYLKILKAVIE